MKLIQTRGLTTTTLLTWNMMVTLSQKKVAKVKKQQACAKPIQTYNRYDPLSDLNTNNGKPSSGLNTS